MATSQSSRRSQRSSGSKPARRRTDRPGAGASVRRGGPGGSDSPLRYLFDGHGHDVWGIAAIVLAAVSAAGIWFSAGAVVGRWIDTVTGALFGIARYLVPVLLAGAGLALIRGPRTIDLSGRPAASGDGSAGSGAGSEEPTTEMRRSGLRTTAIVAGAVLAAVVAMGFAHLIASEGVNVTDDGVDAYRAAGGLVGAGVAATLQGIIGTWGTAAVLIGLAVLATSLLTGWTVGRMARAVVSAAGPLLSAAGRGSRGCSGSPSPPKATEGSDGDPSSRPSLYDQDADGAAPRRSASAARSLRRPTVNVPRAEEPSSAEQLDLDLGPGAQSSPWKLPPAKLLTLSGHHDVDTEAIERRGRVLESALADHGVETRLIGMTAGPTVTRYELELGTGVKVAKVTSLHKDIAYAMASPDVRILAPIPGRQAIGVEVPNAERQVVAVGDILTSAEAKRANHPSRSRSAATSTGTRR
ncbi:MAG: DNA translocase FtsK 4TM domain-containing protein [Microthrixaceae bacterium]